MKNKMRFSRTAKDDYDYWMRQDNKTINRIVSLLTSIDETPFGGIGKPEPLRFSLRGYWSRRIDGKNRIIYTTLNERRPLYN